MRDLEAKAAEGDEWARDRHDLTLALLTDLVERAAAPGEDEETATLSRVRQAGDSGVWRINAELDNGAAVRLLVVFPDDADTAVIACFVGDTARIGDIFYRNVAPRTDAVMEAWAAVREGREALTAFAEAGEELAAVNERPGVTARIGEVRAVMRQADAQREELLEARARAFA